MKITPNIENTTERRAEQASADLLLAAGTEATAFVSPRKAAAEELSIAVLIRRHEAAWQALDAISFCWDLEKDDPRRPALEVEWNRTCDVEDAAFMDICAYPTKTAWEMRAKVDRLTWYFKKRTPTEEQVGALSRSLVG